MIEINKHIGIKTINLIKFFIISLSSIVIVCIGFFMLLSYLPGASVKKCVNVSYSAECRAGIRDISSKLIIVPTEVMFE